MSAYRDLGVSAVRAARLAMQRQLADALTAGSVVGIWNSVVSDAEQLASRDGSRWTDVPYEALLHLGGAREALAQLTDVLVAGDGSALLRLIDVAERLARLNVTKDGFGPILLDTTLTGPIVDLLCILGADAPSPCISRAARLVHHHLAAALTHRQDSEAGLEEVGKLPSALIAWAGEASYGDTLEFCLGSLGFLGEQLDADSEAFLIHHAQSHPHEIAEVAESPGSASALALTRPDLMLRLAGLYYLGRGLSVDGTTYDKGKRPRSRFSHRYASPLGQFDNDDELGEEGVRDHDPDQSRHLAMFPLGNNQANPLLGPFLALLNAHTAEGLHLIGAVVDAATAARARLEAGFDEDFAHDTRVVHLALQVHEGAQREFSGPSTIWCWHRRTTVGPGPAQSALMALREWASARVSGGIALRVVRDQILNTGESLAFVAVAWFVMLEHLDLVIDEMDMFLSQPEVWSLEIMRHVHEPGGTAIAVPEVTRLDWTVSQVAMQLVLRGDGDRRDRLAELGTELVANAQLTGEKDLAVVQRWASELDIANYRAEPDEEGIAVSVEYDPAVLAALAEDGAAAQRGLYGAGLMSRARSMRDGKTVLDEAEPLWHEINEYVREPGGMGVYAPADLVAAAAAGVVRAARDGAAVGDPALRGAVAMLFEAAAEIARVAPPELNTFDQVEGTEDDAKAGSGERFVRDMSWEDGFDRSVATALPWLMADEALMARASVTAEQVGEALMQAAAGPYNQARRRLASGLIPLWQISCNEKPIAHEAAVAAATRLIETAGYGPLNMLGHGYPHATLPSPVAEFLDSSSGLVLDLGAAAYAVAVLAGGSTLECVHAVEGRRVLDALIAYDGRIWPDQYARHFFSGTNLWREQIDSVLARRILVGDRECLQHRLDVFGRVGEQLVGLLTRLSEDAKDAEEATQLHRVWPLILDRLLPSARDLRTSDGGREHPHYRDVEELDQALLLVPGDGVDYWPWAETIVLAIRWLAAFSGRADTADRAIKFASRLFGIQSEPGAQFSLRAMGNDAQAIKRESRLAVAFLQLILRDPPSEAIASQARAVLDGLAAIGDELALDVQRALENG